MKRPKLEKFRRMIYSEQDCADWYKDYREALEQYIDFLEECKNPESTEKNNYEARIFQEIRKTMTEYIQQEYPLISIDGRTPTQMTFDFLIMEIAKLKYNIELLKDHYKTT